MMIKCAITDDEPFARKGLANYIQKIEFLEMAGQFENAIQLNEAITENHIDLVFLDINMPLLSGVDFLRMTKNLPRVIFTTAYPEYAIESFELDVLDYLLKPISFQRFFKSALKAKEYFELLGQSSAKEYMFVKVNKRLEKIHFEDILFLESQQNYVLIYTNENKLMVHSTLKSLLESLPNDDFIQTHKSFVVAKAHIRAIEGNRILIKEFKIPISKYQKQAVLKEITR